MADKKVTVQAEVKVKGGEEVKDTEEKFKSLKSQIRETTVKLQELADAGKTGTKEFKQLSDKLDDLGDAQKRVAFQSGQIEDKLSALPGPIGQIGKGFASAKEAVDTFGKGLVVATGGVILLVSAFFAIKDAMSKTKEGNEALSKATEAFGRILAPVFALLEKVGVFMVNNLLPAINAVGDAFEWIAKKIGVAPEKIKEVNASLQKTNEYANKLAEDEKKRQEDAKKAREEKEAADKKALDNRIARLQAQDKIDEAQLNKDKEALLAKAQTEQGKLNIEVKYAKLSYDQKKKDLEDLQKNYAKDSVEYKGYTAQLIQLDADYSKQKAANHEAQKKIDADTAKQKADDLKAEEEFNKKISAIKTAAIEDETQKALQAREDKYKQDLKDLESDKLFIAKSETEKNAIREALKTGFDNDNEKIKKDARVAALTEELDLLQAQQKVLTDGTQAFFDNERKIEDTAYKIKKEKSKGSKKELEAIEAEHKANLINIDKQEKEARLKLNNAYLDKTIGLAQGLQKIAGENKGLAKAAIRIEQAATTGKIIMNDLSAIRSAYSASPLTFGLPWSAFYAADAIIGVIAANQSANQAIAALDATSATGGGGGGGASANVTPPPTYSGAPQALATPQIQTQGGQNPATAISQTIAGAQQQPIKAYVVSGDISSQQALDRKTNRAATFGLG